MRSRNLKGAATAAPRADPGLSLDGAAGKSVRLLTTSQVAAQLGTTTGRLLRRAARHRVEPAVKGDGSKGIGHKWAPEQVESLRPWRVGRPKKAPVQP